MDGQMDERDQMGSNVSRVFFSPSNVSGVH